jgi:Antibiotic biosynthesis monooxygenase
MSVIMVQEITADPNGLEQFASANKETVRSIVEAAKNHGLIAHRFYGSEDGSKVLVLDEWPDRESFESFAKEQASQIEPMFEAARATEISEPTFWRELTTHDAFGWGA